MMQAIWLATIFGPIMVILGLWMFFHADAAGKTWATMKTAPGVFYMGGLLNLLIGFTVLSFYHMWSWELSVLVTLLGYAHAIRGLLIFFTPQFVLKWSTRFATNSHIQKMSILPFIWGLALCKLAFLEA